MKKILVVILATLSICSCSPKKQKVPVNPVVTTVLSEIAERAYFEGQRDAINNDIRIEYNSYDSVYTWTKSCWDSGSTPTYNPTKEDSKIHN